MTAQPKNTAQVSTVHSLPAATISILALNALTYALQWLNPAVLPAFIRDPAALAAGQWWRLVTPMLVDLDPILVVALKFMGIAVVGWAVEQRLGRVAWLVIYLVSGVIGEVFGYAWNPYSAGFSLPLFGLIGALFVLLMAGKMVRPPAAVLVALSFIAGVIGQLIGGLLVVIVIGFLAGGLGWLMLRQQSLLTRFAAWIGAAGLLGGILLMALGDIHGPAVLTGAGLAAGILFTRNSGMSIVGRR